MKLDRMTDRTALQAFVDTDNGDRSIEVQPRLCSLKVAGAENRGQDKRLERGENLGGAFNPAWL